MCWNKSPQWHQQFLVEVAANLIQIYFEEVRDLVDSPTSSDFLGQMVVWRMT